MKKIKKFKVNIREKRVLALLKFKEGITENQHELLPEITKEIQEAYEYILPAAIYETFKPEEINELYNTSKEVGALLNNSMSVSLAAVTIGQNFDDKVQEFTNSSNVSKAVIWDAIGSEAVEQAANFINRLLKDEANLEACELTTRFSPGYGDWDITQNQKLLEILNTEKIQLSTNECGNLVPQKSITAIIGWQKKRKKKR
ncbi:hypothetical protein ACFL4A_03840 [bacterium]